jgi:nitrogen fixation-related uncharacterized protein
MTKERKIIILLISIAVVIILAAVFLLYWSGSQLQPKSKYANEVLVGNEALLVINNGASERMFKGGVADGATVTDILQAASLAGKFDFSADSEIHSLDGLPANGNKKWQCYLNNQLIKDDLSKETIHPQDRVLCEYK